MKLHIETPLIESLSVGTQLPARVWLKMEALQPCGSFKIRGIGYACRKQVKKGVRALLTSSGGNAGLAVAYAGRCLGVPVTVVVPGTTSNSAIALIQREGAHVIVRGDIWQDAHAHALALANDDAAYIHPFDDADLWEGHASVVDEIADQIAAGGIVPDAVVLSVGGGGLLCGVVEGLRRNGWANVPVLAVETQGADSLSVASLANEHIGIASISSIATSLGATTVARRAFELLSEHDIISHVVSDRDALNGCFDFLEDHRVMVEPACGASLSAVYHECEVLRDKKNIVVIVCGGVGVTMPQLEKWRRSIGGPV